MNLCFDPGTGSACHRALQLPEFLRGILDSLAITDRRTLSNAARLNTLWNDIAAENLWAHPPYHALTRITDTRRRQHYGARVRGLTLTYTAYSRSVEANVNVPLRRLHQLALRVASPGEAALVWLGALLGRVAVQLGSFEFEGGAKLLLRCLDTLRDKQGPLRELTLECSNDEGALDPAQLASFLAACSPELSAC
jgi:hypothetical protein